jgi:G3E family GTPase
VFAQVCADGKTLKRLDKASAASKGSGSKGKKLKLSAEGAKIRSKHTVNTVSLVCEKPLDLDLFNEWVSKLLADKGADIYRIKGKSVNHVSVVLKQIADMGDELHSFSRVFVTIWSAFIGILWMDGYEEQFVVHGVHMIFDGRRGRTWTEAAASLGECILVVYARGPPSYR